MKSYDYSPSEKFWVFLMTKIPAELITYLGTKRWGWTFRVEYIDGEKDIRQFVSAPIENKDKNKVKQKAYKRLMKDLNNKTGIKRWWV